jgi:nucleotide-binding universal stress UspA family protein
VLQEPDIEAELRAYARKTVDAAADQVRKAGVAVETVVIDGRPATAIVEEAERFGAEVIVLGARGHGAIEEMLLGSVSAEVLDTSTIPVLIARGSRLARVLLAWDGSASADRTASLLESWPIFANAAVHVVTVTDTNIPWWAGTSEVASPEVIEVYLHALDEARDQRRKLAESMAARLQGKGLAADAEVREGAPAREILDAAAAILMGTHARTGLVRLALGSVARSVVHHAATSVLIVREPAAHS